MAISLNQVLETVRDYLNMPLSPEQQKALDSLGYNKPLNLHPWLSDMKVHIQMMNGDLELPHIPYDCDVCAKMQKQQYEYSLKKALNSVSST